MKTLRLALLVAAICLAVPTLMMADQVITFDGFADGTVLTNQDFGNGVTFAGATVLCEGGSLNFGQFPPHSGLCVVYNPSGPMTLDFTSPVDFFSGYFTYNSGLTVTAYDGASVVATATGACTANYTGSGCGAPNEFLKVTDPGMITKVTITGGSGNNFTLDDASFTGSINAGTAPEPSLTALLLAGLGGIGYFGRRKRVG